MYTVYWHSCKQILEEEERGIKKVCILSYIAGGLSVYLAIRLFSIDVSIWYPIIIIFIQLLNKLIAIVLLYRNDNIVRTPFMIFEVLYLSFLVFNTNGKLDLFRIQLAQQYVFYLPMSVIAFQLIKSEVIRQQYSTYILCCVVLGMLCVIMVAQLKYKCKLINNGSKFYLKNMVMNVIVFAYLVMQCRIECIVVYLGIMCSWYIAQNKIIIYYLQNNTHLLKCEIKCLLLTTLISKDHSTTSISNKHRYKQNLCSRITIQFILAKSLLLLCLLYFLDQNAIYFITLIIQLEMILPHLATCIHAHTFTYQLKHLSSKKQLIQIFQQYQTIINLNISQPQDLKGNKKKQDNKKNDYEQLIDEEEMLSMQEQMQLLYILYEHQRNGSIISIEQYGIEIGEFCFVAEKCVTIEAIYNLLYNVKHIPYVFLPQYAHYLALNFRDIDINRILRFQIYDVEYQYLGYNQSTKRQLQSTPLSILIFFRDIAQFQSVNPNQIMYDLYESVIT